MSDCAEVVTDFSEFDALIVEVVDLGRQLVELGKLSMPPPMARMVRKNTNRAHRDLVAWRAKTTAASPVDYETMKLMLSDLKTSLTGNITEIKSTEVYQTLAVINGITE